MESNNNFYLIKNKIIYYFDKLKRRSLRISIKFIDENNNIVYLSNSVSHTYFNLKIIQTIYDRSIIDNLTVSDAAELGYIYGLKSRRTNSAVRQISYDYTIDIKEQNNCKLLYLDRKRNICFEFIKENNKEYLTMSPTELLNAKKYLIHFHPAQACYIGILAGTMKASIKPKNTAELYIFKNTKTDCSD